MANHIPPRCLEALSCKGCLLTLQTGMASLLMVLAHTTFAQADGRQAEAGPVQTNPGTSANPGQALPLSVTAAESSVESEALAVSEILLEVSHNQQPDKGVVMALENDKGEILLSRQDLNRWRIQTTQTPSLRYLGQDYFALESLAIRYTLDRRQLTLVLDVPARNYAHTDYYVEDLNYATPDTTSPGAFFNYDLSYQYQEQGSTKGGFFEAGLFNSFGSGNTSFLYREGTNDSSALRLESAWRRDNPETMRTLVLGDTVSYGNSWSGALRFGGVSWSTNFETRPELITLPGLDLQGEVEVPSTLDLYINEALRFRQELEPGPFTLNNIPLITGPGEARLVIRDLLGREQVISQPFFSSSRLLREGLRESAYGLGFLRENFGLSSNDYGDAYAYASQRVGMSPDFTLETQAQLTADTQVLGLGGNWLLPSDILVHAALAYSQHEKVGGQQYSLGLQQQTEFFSAGLEARYANAGYTRIGSAGPGQDDELQLRAFTRFYLSQTSSLGLSYVHQRDRQRPEGAAIYNLSLTRGMGSFGQLGLSALYYADTGEHSINLYFSLPLGRANASASITSSNTQRGSGSTLQIQRSLPLGEGFGYRLSSGFGNNRHTRANAMYQNDLAYWQLEAADSIGGFGMRANMRGSLILMDKQLLASRAVGDSLGLVKVPGFADVRVYADNQVVARTNADGYALLPRLRPYQNNRIRIEQADLPLSSRIAFTEQQTRPYYRSGVIMNFAPSSSLDAWLRIVLEDGTDLPLGATVTTSSGLQFPVGRRGEVYLTDLESSTQITARWQDGACAFTLQLADDTSIFGEPETHICMDITP